MAESGPPLAGAPAPGRQAEALDAELVSGLKTPLPGNF
jgi:hypothetical protein